VFRVLGINHNTAPLEVREKVAFSPEQIPAALQSARQSLGVEGVAILSTCNRTEIYLEGQEPADQRTLDWLTSWHSLDGVDLSPCAYLMEGEQAASHLMRVAAGLDSMVLGEPQILGQLKSAYATAEQSGTLSSGLYRVFHHTFASAKRVRTQTAIGQNPISVAYAAVSLARQIFASFADKTALLIGAGETVALVGRHLREQGVTRILIANRSLDRAEELAQSLDAEARLLEDIPDLLPLADILFTSTASPLPLLGKGAVESALKQRKHRMMFMVDLAVPRDIEPEVGKLDDVWLYTVDDLRDVIDENRRSREAAAAEAEQIIRESVDLWRRDLMASEHSDLIRRYRDQAEQMRRHELEKAVAMLAAGHRPAEVLERFSNALANKLLHQPTRELNRLSRSGDGDEIAMARRLLGIDQPDTEE
jgi:glutamyl-tRNA reductase